MNQTDQFFKSLKFQCKSDSNTDDLLLNYTNRTKIRSDVRHLINELAETYVDLKKEKAFLAIFEYFSIPKDKRNSHSFPDILLFPGSNKEFRKEILSTLEGYAKTVVGQHAIFSQFVTKKTLPGITIYDSDRYKYKMRFNVERTVEIYSIAQDIKNPKNVSDHIELKRLVKFAHQHTEEGLLFLEKLKDRENKTEDCGWTERGILIFAFIADEFISGLASIASGISSMLSVGPLKLYEDPKLAKSYTSSLVKAERENNVKIASRSRRKRINMGALFNEVLPSKEQQAEPAPNFELKV